MPRSRKYRRPKAASVGMVLLVGVIAVLGAYASLRASSDLPLKPAELVWVGLAGIVTAGLTILQIRAGWPGSPKVKDTSPAVDVYQFQLPPDLADFTNRKAEMDRILASLRYAGRESQAPKILAICGPGGIGKTSLAIHTAHLVASRFPDGQLYVNLRGSEDSALDPNDVLDSILRAFGMDMMAIPRTVDERSAALRSMLARQQVLIVLDNAAGPEQIRPLLPGWSECAVIVTVRQRPTGLAGAAIIELDAFAREEALRLFAAIVGKDRVRADAESVGRVLDLLGELPLAVRLAGAKLAAKPHWRISYFATRLSNESTRVGELTVGDQGLRATFLASFRELAPDEAHAFCLMSFVDAKDLEIWAVASLIGVAEDQADGTVEHLVDLRLVEVSHAGNKHVYGLHDVVRAFGRDVGRGRDLDLTAAVGRLATAYASRLQAAGRALTRMAPRHRIFEAPPRVLPAPEPDEIAMAEGPIRWFERELAAIMLTVKQCAELGLHREACQLAVLATPFLEEKSYWSQWLECHRLALRLAEALGDDYWTAVLKWTLGRVYHYLGSWDDTLRLFDEAEGEFRRLGDHRMAAVLQCNRAKVYQLGRFDEALPLFLAAARVFAAEDDTHRGAFANVHVADIYHLKGETESAIEYFERGMTDLRIVGDAWWESNAGIWLGDTYRMQGRIPAALTRLRSSYCDLVQLGDNRRAAVALVHIGDCYRDAYKNTKALSAYLVSIKVFDELGDRWWGARARHGAGEIYCRLRLYSEAATYLAGALPVFEQVANARLSAAAADRLAQARVKNGMSLVRRLPARLPALPILAWLHIWSVEARVRRQLACEAR